MASHILLNSMVMGKRYKLEWLCTKPLTILGFDANLFGNYDSIKVATLPYNSKIPFLNSLLGLERTHKIEFFWIIRIEISW